MLKKLLSAFFVLLALTLFYRVYIHTNTLEVTYHKIVLAHSGNKIRIAHITDLHTKGLGKLEEQLFQKLEQERADLIVITGDLSTPSGTNEGYKSVLSRLKAPKGVFFVNGNWEYWEPISEIKNLLLEAGIIEISNHTIQLENNLWIIGFDDSEAGKPQLDILKNLPKDSVKIGLFHSPDFFERTAGLVEINFAGHSHGGQVRIPFAGHIWVPPGTGEYVQGWFEKNGSKLYVSRGIGDN
jgi:predicted MPP superfamily phosphohydrolase